MQEVIFFIDDDEKLGSTLKQLIEYSNYKVHHFVNGKQALANLEKIEPHLIICDIKMPEMNGYEFYEIFRNMGNHNIPFLFLSGIDDYQEIRKAMNLGADDYLVKPVPILELIKAIKIRLKKSSKIEEVYNQKTEQLKKEIEKKNELISNLNQNNRQ